MKLHNSTAEIFVPDNQPVAEALRRITHLGIGAHQDDLEFMAFHGILQCYHSAKLRFGGITCTNGGGSARSGPYAGLTDEQMKAVRKEEQRRAAVVGRYGVMVQLDYPSKDIKDPADRHVRADLKLLLSQMRPQVVYTHNPADKHDTHIAVVVNVLHALRELPAAQRPAQVIGCEVWRDLDWLPDREKIAMDVSAHENLAAALNGIFDSQIAGGKRYDLATLGRRRANATFFESHATDQSTQLWLGMDLTPLIQDDKLDIVSYVTGAIDRFKTDVARKLTHQVGGQLA